MPTTGMCSVWKTATTWPRLKRPLKRRRRRPRRPSLIAVRTVIGYGSPKAGTNKAHGEAMGAEAVAATKKFFGFPEDQSFYVPDDVAGQLAQGRRSRREA